MQCIPTEAFEGAPDTQTSARKPCPPNAHAQLPPALLCARRRWDCRQGACACLRGGFGLCVCCTASSPNLATGNHRGAWFRRWCVHLGLRLDGLGPRAQGLGERPPREDTARLGFTLRSSLQEFRSPVLCGFHEVRHLVLYQALSFAKLGQVFPTSTLKTSP